MLSSAASGLGAPTNRDFFSLDFDGDFELAATLVAKRFCAAKKPLFSLPAAALAGLFFRTRAPTLLAETQPCDEKLGSFASRVAS